MNRRTFLSLASSLVVPVPEPVRRYFFAPKGGWRRPLVLGGNYDFQDCEISIGGVRFPTGWVLIHNPVPIRPMVYDGRLEFFGSALAGALLDGESP